MINDFFNNNTEKINRENEIDNDEIKQLEDRLEKIEKELECEYNVGLSLVRDKIKEKIQNLKLNKFFR